MIYTERLPYMAEGYTASFTTNTCSYDYFVQDDAMGHSCLDRSKVKKKKKEQERAQIKCMKSSHVICMSGCS